MPTATCSARHLAAGRTTSARCSRSSRPAPPMPAPPPSCSASAAAMGANPYAGLIADANGDLFGTTKAGGTSNLGTVFEIVKTGTTYASAPTTLLSFNGSNGANPYASLTADANGNLYGTTYSDG